jgi:hypothetical protein
MNLYAIKQSFLFILLGIQVCAQPGSGIITRDNGLTVSYPDGSIPAGCTVFTVSKGENVFFGGNDDYINPDSYYWVDPGDSGKYGVIWIGTPDNVQQGVNEKGLAYDANGLPRVNVNSHPERIPVTGAYTIYPIRILHECASVEQVIDWINSHQWHSYMQDQMQFADATGDAVIISAGKDGEVVFTRKPEGDGFLVSTNFNVANPSDGYGFPDWRYDRAQNILDRLVNGEGIITLKDITDVLDSVHLERGSSWTIESMAADLVSGDVWLYYYYQFDNPLKLNVKDELAHPREPGPLSKLFPEEVRKVAKQRYELTVSKSRLCRNIGIFWTASILVSLLLLFIFPALNRKGLKFWIPAVIVLGPLALLVRIIVLPGRKDNAWRKAVIEATGNIIPVASGYLLALVLLVLMLLSGGVSDIMQAVMIIGIPLIFGWLVFHAPLLKKYSNKNSGRFLLQRLALVVVSTNLGIAGMIPIALPLVNKNLILPLTGWTIMAWWAFIVLGSLTGSILLLIYEIWAGRQGYVSWNIVVKDEGEVRTPSWRKLWWWILISLLVLILGLIAAVTRLKSG